MLSDAPAMLVDLGAIGELLARYVVQLFEQWYIAVGFVVALQTGEAVPVPDTAEVTAELDDPDVIDTGLLQIRRAQQTAEAAAQHGDVDVRRDQIADERRRVRVGFVVLREVVNEFDILLGTFWTKPLFTFSVVPYAQGFDIDIVWRLRGRTVAWGHARAFSGRAARCNLASS
jgi:hypothetical protein